MRDLQPDTHLRLSTAIDELLATFALSGLHPVTADRDVAADRAFELGWERLLLESGLDREAIRCQLVEDLHRQIHVQLQDEAPDCAEAALPAFAAVYASCMLMAEMINDPDELAETLDVAVAMSLDEALPEQLAELRRYPQRPCTTPPPADLDGWLAECAWVRERLPLIRSCRLSNGRSQRLTGPERLVALVAERRGFTLERDEIRRAKHEVPGLRGVDESADETDLLATWLSLHVALAATHAVAVTSILILHTQRLRRREEERLLARLTGRAVELELVLKHVEPRVSRRLAVDAGSDLFDLHLAIQAVMDWDDSHLWQFENNRVVVPCEPPKRTLRGDDRPVLDPAQVTVADALLGEHAGPNWCYRYDFGDDWRLDLTVLGEGPVAPGEALPSCRDAVGAAPPEDCGGPLGYAGLLQALADPQHPLHAEWTEWLDDEDFDPTHCDRTAIDEDLARLIPPPGRSPPA